MSRILFDVDSGANGVRFSREYDTLEAVVAASPGLVHWLDPDPEFVYVNSPGSELHWRARVGGSIFTSIYSGAGGVTKTTNFNSKPTITANANGIFYPLHGRFAYMPFPDPDAGRSGSYTIVTVLAVDDTVTRTLLGTVPTSVGESAPLALWCGTNGGRFRRWSNDAVKQVYSLPSITTGATTIIVSGWSATGGTRHSINTTATGVGTVSPSGTDFGSIGTKARPIPFRIFTGEAQTSTNRWKGSIADIMIFDEDYHDSLFDTHRAALVTALATKYGVTLS
jgi:hypothetical protein